MKIKLKIPTASMKADGQKIDQNTDHPQGTKNYDVSKVKSYETVEVPTQMKIKVKIPTASMKADGQEFDQNTEHPQGTKNYDPKKVTTYENVEVLTENENGYLRKI